MGEPAARRVPWGLLLTIVLLSLLLGTLYRSAPWGVILATVGMAVGALLVLRTLQGYLWGVLGALALSLHPFNGEWTAAHEQAMQGEALELLVLAAVAGAWELAARPSFAGLSWLLTAVVVCVAGGLAWPALPQAGLVAALLTLLGLPLGALLAGMRHLQRPAWGNVVVAIVLGLAAPVLGLLLASASVRLFDWGPVRTAFDFLGAAVSAEAVGLDVRVHAVEQIHRWAWPAVWAVLPLALLGLWLTMRRGRKALAARRPALPWVLTLYALLECLGVLLRPASAAATVVLPLASIALLLALFGVGEIVRAIFKPLVLPPPGERAAEEA